MAMITPGVGVPRPFAASVVGLAFLALSNLVVASQQVSFEGDLTFEDIGLYPHLPFNVPEGTTTIQVSYFYSCDIPPPLPLDPVLDIGIYDPRVFRGWSGSARTSFVVSESRDLTTDGYAPGEIPAGPWYVELGVGLIYPEMVMHYDVQVELGDDPVGEPFEWPHKQEVVISNEARWYMGDLHCHSTHSDGTYPMEDVFEYAASRGLDFVALTDHNGFSHWLYLSEMQGRFPTLLLLYGEELTTYRGHANVFDIDRPVDYHGTVPGYDINEVIEAIHDDGGYFSPNHPLQPVVPLGNSYLGWGWAFPETDWGLVDFYEVVNGPSVIFGMIPNPFNGLAIMKWEELLSQGHKITAVGGSDDHWAGQGSDPLYAPIGMPTDVVYAEELSPTGIFDALKAGHLYIIAEGPQGPRIDFTARSQGTTAMIGDTIAGRDIEFRVEITGGIGRTFGLWRDGLPWVGRSSIAITQDPFVYTFSIHPGIPGRIRVQIQDGACLSALTNPIYFAPGHPAWEVADVRASAMPGSGESDPALYNVVLMLFLTLAFALTVKGTAPRASRRRRLVDPTHRAAADTCGRGPVARRRGASCLP